MSSLEEAISQVVGNRFRKTKTLGIAATLDNRYNAFRYLSNSRSCMDWAPEDIQVDNADRVGSSATKIRRDGTGLEC